VPLWFGPSRELLDTGTDTGTRLLVLSTYARLLDLYQKVAQNVKIEIFLSRSGDAFQLCKILDVSVGSFPILLPHRSRWS